MSRRPAAEGELHCPACGTGYPDQERFCPDCKLPLVQGEGSTGVLETVGERHERARKIKPQLTEGRLVRVAGGRNQAEAEFIQGLLLEEGVPSMLRRTAAGGGSRQAAGRAPGRAPARSDRRLAAKSALSLRRGREPRQVPAPGLLGPRRRAASEGIPQRAPRPMPM